MSEIKELPIEIIKPIPLPPDVFLYVNPLTGKHASTVQDKKLAVFDPVSIMSKRTQASKIMIEKIELLTDEAIKEQLLKCVPLK